jgi:hypothetical protein
VTYNNVHAWRQTTVKRNPVSRKKLENRSDASKKFNNISQNQHTTYTFVEIDRKKDKKYPKEKKIEAMFSSQFP